MYRVAFLILFTSAICQTLHGQDSQSNPTFQPDPELEPMAFLIGRWELDTWFSQEDGTKQRSIATMEAKYTLDGKGIEMTARYKTSEGNPDFVSVHTFVFNPRLGKIIGSGINTLGNWKSFEVAVERDRLVITQAGMLFQGRPGINRRTMYDIGTNSYKAILDHSPDGGKTWQEGTFGLTATRVP